MNKKFLAVLFLLLLGASKVSAALSEEAKQDIFLMFDSNVLLAPHAKSELQVNDKGNIVELVFPAFEIKNPEGTTKRIPSYTMLLTPIDLFQGLPQFSFKTSEFPRLQAMLYPFMMLSQARAETYVEESNIVPALQFATSQSMKIRKLVFSEVDEETGLQQDWVSLDLFDLTSKAVEGENGLDYEADMRYSGFNMKMPFFTMRVPNAAYKFNMKNAEMAKRGKLPVFADKVAWAFKTDEISSSVPMLGTAIKFKLDSKGVFDGNREANTLTMNSKFGLTDLKVETQFPLDNLPTSVEMQFIAKGIDYAKILEVQKLQEEYMETSATAWNSNENEEEEPNPMQTMIFSKMKEAFTKGEMTYAGKVLFENGAILAQGVARLESDDNVATKTELSIINMDVISPDYTAACMRDQAVSIDPEKIPESCMKFGMLNQLRPYLDFSKRTMNDKGQTVDKFVVTSSKGNTFINGKMLPKAPAGQ